MRKRLHRFGFAGSGADRRRAMLQLNTPLRDRPDIPDRDSTFEMYLRIPPVVVIYGTDRSLHASEHVSSLHLMRELSVICEKGLRIRGVLDSSRGVLTVPSLRALNCYLRHGLHRFGDCKGRLSSSPASRFAWVDLCHVVNLQWQAAGLS